MTLLTHLPPFTEYPNDILCFLNLAFLLLLGVVAPVLLLFVVLTGLEGVGVSEAVVVALGGL